MPRKTDRAAAAPNDTPPSDQKEVPVFSSVPNVGKEADQLLLSRYMPPGVLVNQDLQIVRFQGAAFSYLQPGPGAATLDLLQMVPRPLAADLRNLIRVAAHTGLPARKDGLAFPRGQALLRVCLEVVPLPGADPHYLVVFLEDTAALQAEERTRFRETEAALTRTSQLNATILDSIRDVFFAIDNGWRCTFLSRQAETFIGKSREEVLHRNLWDVLHPYIGTALHTQVLESMRTKRFTEFEFYAGPVAEWQHYRIYPSAEGLSIFCTNISERKQAEQTIRDSERRYQTFIRQSTEGIWRFELEVPVPADGSPEEQTDRFYRYAYLAECNDAMARMYGYSHAAEIIGARLADLLPRNADSEAYFRAFIESGYKLTDAETAETDRYGGDKYFLNNMVGIVEDGCLVRAWGTQRDITRQHRSDQALEQARQQLKLALSAGRVGIWVRHLKTGELRWTPEQEALFGLPEGSFDGRPETWERAVHPEDLPAVMEKIRSCIAGGQDIANEYRIVLPDGSHRWILTKAQVLRDARGRPEQLTGVSINITERKQLEQQKDAFIGIASHELKTPVTAIKAYTGLLLDIFEETGDRQAVSLMRKLDGQVDRLTGLIRSLLDVTRLSEGSVAPRQDLLDINQVVREKADELQLTATRHQLKTFLEPVPPVRGDREQLGQVLVNLLSNAIKYSPNAGQVIITTRAEGDAVRITVTDFGIGIGQDLHDKIFTRFFRAGDPAANTFPGLGLGLYIAAEIIRGHGGSITLSSRKGEGSVFTVTLPLPGGS